MPRNNKKKKSKGKQRKQERAARKHEAVRERAERTGRVKHAMFNDDGSERNILLDFAPFTKYEHGAARFSGNHGCALSQHVCGVHCGLWCVQSEGSWRGCCD